MSAWPRDDAKLDRVRALMGERGPDVLGACVHYPGRGIGCIAHRDGRVVWQQA